MPVFAEGGVVRKEVLAFAIPGFLLLGLLAAISFWVARDVAQEESVRDAVVAAQQAEQWVVAPEVTEALGQGDPASIAALDEVVRNRLLADPLVTVRLWDADGTIVYSDKPQLIGERFDLGPEELEVLADGGVEAEVSDLSKPENRFERTHGELIEVYLPVTGADGSTYLMEVYTKQAFLEAQTQALVRALAPAVLGALAVLALILLLLAWRMARRLDRDRQQREDLLLYAVNSSEAERRRIAADLHDGVVQDLAGVSFGLSAMASGAEDVSVQRQLTTAADRTRKAVGSLRTLLVDIYPPNLRDAGLGAALQDLGNGLDADVEVEVDPLPPLDDTCQQALYRVARESTQNVAKHSGATTVTIRLKRHDDCVVLEVIDNGQGFDAGRSESGHVGLALMQDLATQLGGDLRVESTRGQGTAVRFELECTR
ncbi:MAG: sensor histidine kinase [Candidatus Nanopelagicales bacterium]|nr:sensor histidine kinase [Actinomycetota bacterium]